jgi:hypothetical protein
MQNRGAKIVPDKLPKFKSSDEHIKRLEEELKELQAELGDDDDEKEK